MKTLASILALLLASCTSQPAGPRALYAMDTCTKVHYPNSDVHSPEQQLDLVKKHGYAGIAWTAEEPARVAALARAARERGVPMFAIYVGAELTRDGLKPDPRLAAILAAAPHQDAILWLHLGSTAFSHSDAAGDALAVPALQAIADAAAKQGWRVAIYPHMGEWTERFADALRLAQKVDRRNFGVTFNLCHSLMAGDEERIPALLQEAAPLLLAVTLNGADQRAAHSSWGRLIQPIGSGDYPVAELLRQLDRIGYRGPIALQGFGVRLAPEVKLEQSMAAWRRIEADLGR